jgi:hypothetical protein
VKYFLEDYLPKSIPDEWQEYSLPETMLNCYKGNAKAYMSSKMNNVFFTVDDFGEGGQWLHLSVSCHQRLPTWEELKKAKETFMGDIFAMQVLPPKNSYLNINPYVLHLFSRLDAPTIPSKVWRTR